MIEDEKNVPRRLRRFYRKGETIPEEMKKKPIPAPDARAMVADTSQNQRDEEPWMNPSKNEIPNPRRRRGEGVPASATQTPAQRTGRFERMLETTQKNPATHVDKALGLGEKALFEERLPNTSNSAIEGKEGKNKEIEHTLKELKDLASLGNPNTKDTTKGPTSFHFTPVGGAPNIPNPHEIDNPAQKQSSIVPPTTTMLSPRERMESRRQRMGQAPTPPSIENKSPLHSDENPTPHPLSHIRRRMGQATPERSEMENDDAPNVPSPQDSVDLHDLLENPKKKKKIGKEGDEDDDLSLGDDFPLLEDDK